MLQAYRLFLYTDTSRRTHTHTQFVVISEQVQLKLKKSSLWRREKKKKRNQDIPVGTHEAKKKKTSNQTKVQSVLLCSRFSSRLNNSRATDVNSCAISLYTSGRIQMRKHPYSKKIDASSGWHGGHRVSQAGSDHPVTGVKWNRGFGYFCKCLFFLIFCLPCVAQEILFPQARIEPASLEGWSLTRRSAREVQILLNFQNTWVPFVILTNNNGGTKEAKDSFTFLLQRPTSLNSTEWECHIKKMERIFFLKGGFSMFHRTSRISFTIWKEIQPRNKSGSPFPGTLPQDLTTRQNISWWRKHYRAQTHNLKSASVLQISSTHKDPT